MNYSIEFTPAADKTIRLWKKSNHLLHKKLLSVLLDISRHPRSGIGHPEPLKSGNGLIWSRRISAHDRVIYDIDDQMIRVLIVEAGGHYSDK